MSFSTQYSQLRAKRALSIFKAVLLRTRRALSMYRVYVKAPFWLSTKYLWVVIAPVCLSTDDIVPIPDRDGLKHKDSFGKSENLSKIFFAEILVFDHDYEGNSSSSNGLLWISFINFFIIYLNYFSNCSEGLRTNLYTLSTILCKV